jgi:hypothetical protein
MNVVPRLLTKKPAFPVQRIVVRSAAPKARASNGCVAGGLACEVFCAAAGRKRQSRAAGTPAWPRQ